MTMVVVYGGIPGVDGTQGSRDEHVNRSEGVGSLPPGQ